MAINSHVNVRGAARAGTTVILLCAAVVATLVGCRSEPPEDENPRAAYRIARALCGQMWACEETHDLGHSWASVEDCALGQAGYIGMEGQAPPSTTGVRVACDEARDVELSAEELNACLRAVEQVSCEEALGTAYLYPYLPSECDPFFEAWTLAENAWRGAIEDGEVCNPGVPNRCGLERRCVQTEGDNLGTCQPRWLAQGDDCVDEDERVLDCGPRLFCVDGVCRREPPQAGETCAFNDQCAPGVDCDRSTRRCVQRFRAGGACDARDECGQWFACVDDRCRPRYEAEHGLGASCQVQSDCLRSVCIEGTCQPAPGVGEACLTECVGRDCPLPCQRSLICVEGTCQESPGCGTARGGERCAEDYQCAEGFACYPSVSNDPDDGPSCRSVPTLGST